MSIWSSYYIDLSPEDMVCAFEKSGIGYAELSDEHALILLQRGDAQTVGRQFKAFTDAHHVSFSQGHLWLGCSICQKDRAAVVATLKTWLDLFGAIGVKRAVLHCDCESFPETTSEAKKLDANISVLKELAAYLKGTDIIICLENLIEFTAGVDSLLQIVHVVGGENIGICLDTGHLNLTYKNQEDFIKKAGKHLKALHIADNEGQTDQHMMPFGRGRVDFIKVVQALKEIGFDGTFNLEIPGENRCPLAIRNYKIDYIKNMYAYLLEQ